MEETTSQHMFMQESEHLLDKTQNLPCYCAKVLQLMHKSKTACPIQNRIIPLVPCIHLTEDQSSLHRFKAASQLAP